MTPRLTPWWLAFVAGCSTAVTPPVAPARPTPDLFDLSFDVTHMSDEPLRYRTTVCVSGYVECGGGSSDPSLRAVFGDPVNNEGEVLFGGLISRSAPPGCHGRALYYHLTVEGSLPHGCDPVVCDGEISADRERRSCQVPCGDPEYGDLSRPVVSRRPELGAPCRYGDEGRGSAP